MDKLTLYLFAAMCVLHIFACFCRLSELNRKDDIRIRIVIYIKSVACLFMLGAPYQGEFIFNWGMILVLACSSYFLLATRKKWRGIGATVFQGRRASIVTNLSPQIITSKDRRTTEK